MKIICHRGFWKKKQEHNTLSSCLRAFDEFDGVEIDLRSLNHKIVLSHDPVLTSKKYCELSLILKKAKGKFLGLNIKEDGLSDRLTRAIKQNRIKNYMCFDLSTPEKILYRKHQLKIFDRFGDQDQLPSTKNLVIDIFSTKNWRKVLTDLHQHPHKNLFFISPELHGQSHRRFWKLLRELNFYQNNHFLCTDYPEEAKKYFNSGINDLK